MTSEEEMIRAIARSNTPDEIRSRMARIESNLANPVAACRGASLTAARRDAAGALSMYRAALRLIRCR